jgi:hypothetical protein
MKDEIVVGVWGMRSVVLCMEEVEGIFFRILDFSKYPRIVR